MTPYQLQVIENSSATLICAKTNGLLLESRWENSQFAGQEATLYYRNGQCIMTAFLKNSAMFDGLCNGNGIFSVLLKNINRTQHGVEWKCRETYFSQPSNTVVTQVAGTKVNFWSCKGVFVIYHSFAITVIHVCPYVKDDDAYDYVTLRLLCHLYICRLLELSSASH